ncbi:hypothetical protein [Mycobacterium shimoidei]|nr:hypothetical protein [Mycobacterium shimoidei]
MATSTPSAPTGKGLITAIIPLRLLGYVTPRYQPTQLPDLTT